MGKGLFIHRAWTLSIAFFFIGAAPFIAENGFAAETLTLEEAIRTAIMQHPDVRAARYRLETDEAGIVAAKASLKRILELQNSLKLNISLETRQAFYTAQSAFKRINVAEGAVEEAAEALRIVQDRYANGILPLVSLLDAETSHQQALTHHFQARHDYQAARIDLALATGIIDADFK